MRNKYIQVTHISERKTREIIRLFSLDIEAEKTAELTGVSRSTNKFYNAFRERIANICEAEAPFENGTIEQMNVTPVSKFTFILSKLIPYWAAGFVVILLCMLTAFIFYGMFPKGSILLLYIFAVVFVLSFSGFGLIVSNYAKNIQQAIFIMFFFVITMIFISGLYTPYQNMPEWAQMLGNVSPLKYFIQSLRMIYLKGATFTDMQHLFYPLCELAVFFNGWAVLSYRKKSA